MRTEQQIKDLVSRFALNHDAYVAPKYNEAQARAEFIEPLFALLGWDVYNSKGYAEPYKDVVHEDHMQMGGAAKAPDYSFRVGGQRKFFLEAKKPAVDISHDKHPAYQLRRYAWSAHLPLSILTDFEQLAVYDCTVRPGAADRPPVARVMHLQYQEYLPRWDELWSVFSRDSVLKGGFDRFASAAVNKRGTTRVDREFLKEIEKWRSLLAKQFSAENHLSDAELNYAVQMTIDRIIFLRMAEERGMEAYGGLRDVANTSHIYRGLCGRFRQADGKYNSGLFHFQQERGQAEAPDALTPSLRLDDQPLRAILRGLYFPECPYEFSVLPADVLGQVYEQFLGKSVVRSDGGRVRIVEKPEVRKAGGVFYTPKYIVDYIVKHTVGQLLRQAKGSARASRLRILDPACGSGSFLLGAYSYLLTWHRDTYLKHGPERHRQQMYETAARGWALATQKKKKILLSSIYGVDVDPQAVEVSKLSLLLKVLDGESEETIDAQLKMFQERALPSLARNIKCGNSIVGMDFPDDAGWSPPNPFEWADEFEEVVRREKGFDVVISNPPYVSEQSEYIPEPLYRYLLNRYPTMERISDYFCAFVEQALRLLRPGGMLGFVLPSTFLGNVSFRKLRKLLLDTCQVAQLVHLGDGVFEGAVVPTCIIVAQKGKGSGRTRAITDVRDLYREDYECALVPQATYATPPHFTFHIGTGDVARDILTHAVKGSTRLGDLLNIKEGIKTGDDSSFLANVPFPRNNHPVLKGRDIERYVASPCRYIRYAPEELSRPQAPEHFDVPEKLVIRRVGDHLTAAYDSDQLFCVHTLYTGRLKPGASVSLKYLLGLLNSRLLNYCYRAATPQKGRVFPEVRIYSLNELPVQVPTNPKSGEQHDLLVQLVERMLRLTGTAQQVRTPNEREQADREAESLDRRIDELIYEIYGLSRKEVSAVESFVRGGKRGR